MSSGFRAARGEPGERLRDAARRLGNLSEYSHHAKRQPNMKNAAFERRCHWCCEYSRALLLPHCSA